MKRTMALLIVLCMSAAAFTGCAQTAAPAATETTAPAEAPAGQAAEEPPASEGGVLPAPNGFGGKAITVINPYAAGGGTDVLLRKLAEVISLEYGVTIVIENVTGSSGAVGLSQALAAKPDGYTLGIIGPGVQSLFAQELYDYTPEDCTFVNVLFGYPSVMVIRKDLWKNYEEFITAALDKPGALKIGHNATLSCADALTIALCKAYDDPDLFVNVPYDGAARAVTELIGGHIDAVIGGTGDVMNYIDQFHCIVMGEASSLLPDSPSIYDCGLTREQYPDVGYARQFIVGPKGMDEDVTAYIASLFASAYQTEEMKTFAVERACDLDGSVGSDLKTVWDSHYAATIDWVSIFD